MDMDELSLARAVVKTALKILDADTFEEDVRANIHALKIIQSDYAGQLNVVLSVGTVDINALVRISIEIEDDLEEESNRRDVRG